VNSGVVLKLVDILAVTVSVVVSVFGRIIQTVEGSPGGSVTSQLVVCGGAIVEFG
jgi:hypothetical protein